MRHDKDGTRHSFGAFIRFIYYSTFTGPTAHRRDHYEAADTKPMWQLRYKRTYIRSDWFHAVRGEVPGRRLPPFAALPDLSRQSAFVRLLFIDPQPCHARTPGLPSPPLPPSSADPSSPSEPVLRPHYGRRSAVRLQTHVMSHYMGGLHGCVCPARRVQAAGDCNLVTRRSLSRTDLVSLTPSSARRWEDSGACRHQTRYLRH